MNNRQKQIEQARRLIATGISEDLVAVLHQQFPELAESEDERIRQLLVRFVKYDMDDNYSDDISKDSCLAYLEKQKEQKPAEWSEEDKRMLNDVDESLYCYETGKHSNVIALIEEERNWLKSLRPQPHWKPDVEDYKALNRAIEMADELGESRTCEILKGIRIELKSL